MSVYRAPAGGTISRVNGEFYKGGRFVPDTGLYCGAKRRAKKHAGSEGNWAVIRISEGWRNSWFVEYRLASESRWRYAERKPFASCEEAVAYAEAVLAARAEAYSARGLAPHPTEIEIKE